MLVKQPATPETKLILLTKEFTSPTRKIKKNQFFILFKQSIAVIAIYRHQRRTSSLRSSNITVKLLG